MAKVPPSVNQIMVQVMKKYPLSFVNSLGGDEKSLPLDVISTGCLRLDYALGAGGIPRYRFAELWGPDKAGKTTLMSTMMARLSVTPQADGREWGTSVLIDMERKLDRDYFERCIVNSGGNLGTPDDRRCFHIQPDSGKGALETALALVGQVDLIIFDSITWFTPSKIEDKNAGAEDSFYALAARILGPYLQRLSSVLFRSGRDDSLPIGTAFVGVCQARAEINQYRAVYREKLRPGGARAWKHIRSVQIFMRPHGYGLGKPVYDTQGETYGAMTKVVVEKSVIGNPRQFVEKPPVLMRFGTGIDLADDAIEIGLQMGLVEYKKPSYFWPGGERIAAGRQRTIEYLNDVNPQARDELRAEISRRIQERAKSGTAFETLIKFLRWNVASDGEPATYVKRQ